MKWGLNGLALRVAGLNELAPPLRLYCYLILIKTKTVGTFDFFKKEKRKRNILFFFGQRKRNILDVDVSDDRE